MKLIRKGLGAPRPDWVSGGGGAAARPDRSIFSQLQGGLYLRRFREEIVLGFDGHRGRGNRVFEPNLSDAFRQAKPFQCANPPPIHIDFIPRQSMPRRGRMGMMIVVPSLSKRQPGHPPIVT